MHLRAPMAYFVEALPKRPFNNSIGFLSRAELFRLSAVCAFPAENTALPKG